MDGVPAMAIRVGVDSARRPGHNQFPAGLDDAGTIEYATVRHLTALVGLVQQLPLVAVSIEALSDPDEVVARLDGVDGGASRNVRCRIIRARPDIGSVCRLSACLL